MPPVRAAPAGPVLGSALYSGAAAAFFAPNPRGLAAQALLPLSTVPTPRLDFFIL